jgi:TfoX/Sxy family transcriptional regulator of competence genes
MAFDEYLAERISTVLNRKGVSFKEKKMMGGLAFMVDGKICVGVVKDSLMARIDPDLYESLLSRQGVRPMDFTGRPMRGFVFVDPGAIDRESNLENFIDLALEWNPHAKASKKRKA